METVIFGEGLVTRDKILELIDGRKHLIVIDGEVLANYPDLFAEFNTFRAPAGEEAKTIEIYEQLISAANVSYLIRGGVVIGVGGGAVLDLAGFFASTYMRGVSYIAVPTTLTAMCDASIGGKNALNTLTAKNEIGTFYFADKVLIDPHFLRSLPKRHMLDGLGEIIKYAIGFAPKMLLTLAEMNPLDIKTLLPIIRESVAIKQRIVQQDFTDIGIRKTLNFGHTLGHAIEYASGYEVSHGAAVGVGCHYMSAWANREAVLSDKEMDLIDACYRNLGLPTDLRELDTPLEKNVVFSHVLSDKKMADGAIDLIKLKKLGQLGIARTPLDVFYDEVFRAPKERLSMYEQWKKGMGLPREERPAEPANGGKGASKGAGSHGVTLVTGDDGTGSTIEGAKFAKGMTGKLPMGMGGSQEVRENAVINLPVSKSYAHRFLILAAFADVPTVIDRFDISDDLASTISALKAISGARFSFKQDELMVIPKNVLDKRRGSDTQRLGIISAEAAGRIDVDCGSSASTARFLIPFSNLRVRGRTYFYGSESLENRPMGSIIEILKMQNLIANPEYTKSLPFTVTGALKPGVFRLDGDLSSQFLSGLLMAGPRLGERSRIIVRGRQVSKPYVLLTLDAMRRMGVTVDRKTVRREVSQGWFEEENIYNIQPGSYAARGRITIEKDYSQAAFWIVAEILRQERGGDFRRILLPGLNPKSLQGDRRILEILGAEINGAGEIRKVKRAAGVVDVTSMPDLFPILSVYYTLNGTGGVIIGADRVSYKESDRYEAMKMELTRLGGRFIKEGSRLKVVPSELVGRTVSAHNDHRVAMSLLIAALFVPGIKLDSADSISKSYPRFADDYAKLVGED